MEYLSQLFSTMLVSVTALFGAQAPQPVEQPRVPARPEPVAESQQLVQTYEDEALSGALSELRGVREKLKQPEVVDGAYPQVRRPDITKKNPAVTPPSTSTPSSLKTPSFVTEATQHAATPYVEPTSGSPLAASFDRSKAIGAILMKPLPYQNIELAYREVPAALGSHYELQWDIPKTLTCSFIVFLYKSDAQVSSTWMKTVAGVGKRDTDPLYQDQRYRLLCRDEKGTYHSDTILFRTRSQARELPTCTIVPSKNRVKNGETITYTIGGSDIETFAFGNNRPTVPSTPLKFPFEHKAVVRAGEAPFTVTVGNRLGTSTCNSLITIEP
jgi:hypothetical protein